MVKQFWWQCAKYIWHHCYFITIDLYWGWYFNWKIIL